jgi:hypothetical protein
MSASVSQAGLNLQFFIVRQIELECPVEEHDDLSGHQRCKRRIAVYEDLAVGIL